MVATQQQAPQVVTATPQQFHTAMALLDWLDAGHIAGQPNLRVKALANGRYRHVVVSMSIQRKQHVANGDREVLTAKQVVFLAKIYQDEAVNIKRHTQWENRAATKPAAQPEPTPIAQTVEVRVDVLSRLLDEVASLKALVAGTGGHLPSELPEPEVINVSAHTRRKRSVYRKAS
jgi:hypothetical protein